MCMYGVMSDLSLSVPSLASMYAISFPLIPMCARTLCMCIMCGVQYIWCMMAAMVTKVDEANSISFLNHTSIFVFSLAVHSF